MACLNAIHLRAGMARFTIISARLGLSLHVLAYQTLSFYLHTRMARVQLACDTGTQMHGSIYDGSEGSYSGTLAVLEPLLYICRSHFGTLLY